jgi:phosphatidylinositol alpha-mannosyltransferase
VPGPASPQPTTLRIALVCPYSLSRPGGVQGQVVGLARVLGARGHQVRVFAPLDRAEDAPAGIDLTSTGRSVAVPGNGSVAPVTLSPSAVADTRRTLLAGGYDVVHLHEPFAPGLPLGLLLGGKVPPAVATFHRSGTGRLYSSIRPLTRRLAHKLSVRCAVSEAAATTARMACGAPCEVGFNGVDVAGLRSATPWPTDRPTVLFLGRHEERKGLGVLLSAFAGLGAGASAQTTTPPGDRPVLWIAGDGPETDRLRRMHPSSDDVVWLGVLSESDRDRRLAGADVLCAPALGGESFGMVLVEAMASETVVVASDIDGYRGAAGGHAVLVPPEDAGALAGALEDVLAGKGALLDGDRQRWVDEASAWASAWSMDRLADWYEGHYRTAMVSRPR